MIHPHTAEKRGALLVQGTFGHPVGSTFQPSPVYLREVKRPSILTGTEECFACNSLCSKVSCLSHTKPLGSFFQTHFPVAVQISTLPPALVFSKNQWPQPNSMHYSSILHPPATPLPSPLCPASPFSERNVSLPLLPLFQNSVLLS